MVTYRYCPECGNRVLLGMRFCTKCGTPIPHTEEDTALVPEPTAEEILAATETVIPVPEPQPEVIPAEQEIKEVPPAEVAAEPVKEPLPEEAPTEECREIITEPKNMPALPKIEEATEPVPEIPEALKAEVQMRDQEASQPEESELSAAMISDVITTVEKEKDAMAKTARDAVEEVVAENSAGMPENTEHLVEGTIQEIHASKPAAKKRKRYDPESGEPLKKGSKAKAAGKAAEEAAAETAAEKLEITEQTGEGTMPEPPASKPPAKKRKRYDPESGEPLGKDAKAKPAGNAAEEAAAQPAAEKLETPEPTSEGTMPETPASEPSTKQRKRYEPESGEPLE